MGSSMGRESSDIKVKRGALRLAQTIQGAASAKEVLRAFDMSAKAVRSMLQPTPLQTVLNRFGLFLPAIDILVICSSRTSLCRRDERLLVAIRCLVFLFLVCFVLFLSGAAYSMLIESRRLLRCWSSRITTRRMLALRKPPLWLARAT